MLKVLMKKVNMQKQMDNISRERETLRENRKKILERMKMTNIISESWGTIIKSETSVMWIPGEK